MEMNAATRNIVILYLLLTKGSIERKTLIQRYTPNHGENERSDSDEYAIRRSIKTINTALRELPFEISPEVTLKDGVYSMDTNIQLLGRTGTLALAKILLASRALPTKDLDLALDQLLRMVEDPVEAEIRDFIRVEKTNYQPVKGRPSKTGVTEINFPDEGEPEPGKPAPAPIEPPENQVEDPDGLMQRVWDFSQFVEEHADVEVDYMTPNGHKSHSVLAVLAVTFSEHYFYVVAYNEAAKAQYVYRLDRIDSYHLKRKNSQVVKDHPLSTGKQEPKMYYMRGGRKDEIEFEYDGTLVTVRDVFPNLKVVTENVSDPLHPHYRLKMNTYTRGAMMWLLSQGAQVKVLNPPTFARDFKEQVAAMAAKYTK